VPEKTARVNGRTNGKATGKAARAKARQQQSDGATAGGRQRCQDPEAGRPAETPRSARTPRKPTRSAGISIFTEGLHGAASYLCTKRTTP
jgi:hypothetical protein